MRELSKLAPTMTSREIAELTGKRHDNVMADIRKMLVELHGEDLVLSFQQTVERPNPSGGAPIPSPIFRLPKRETLILVSGYSVAMRARIIDRWHELEAAAAAPAIAIPQTLPEALRLAADLAEQKAQAEAALIQAEQWVELVEQCGCAVGIVGIEGGHAATPGHVRNQRGRAHRA